ncbi:LAME_0G08680g1_1 [Lachancea meyersii CBS 8951]|uniref:Large ribosomal subunit protein bL34m n=1 Tax=Lachancea meyersii CBS 8951 TaxID=1266667 RepID=A0A1G4K8B0_9SACH|nr:LAME_0G08680g1_1 [Lachancea meyersii CBS 8951]
MSFITRNILGFSSRRNLTTLTSFSPLKTGLICPSVLQVKNTTGVETAGSAFPGYLSMLFGLTQRRWKSRGNTYQPSTLKRKRRVGFLARAKSKQGYKILKKRREKGRWYLTH